MSAYSNGRPIRKAILYALLAGIWIIASDWLLARFTSEHASTTLSQTYKGWIFVMVTATALYLVLRHELKKLHNEIEAHHETEKALRESEARLIRAQQVATMGDFTWDLETGGITWSAGMYDLMRYDKNDPVDFEMVKSNVFHPGDQERVNQWLQDSIASSSGELPPNEYRVLRKDGETIFIRTQGIIERNEARKPRVFAVVVDITDRIRTEREREKLQLRVVQAQKMESVGRLAGGVAHDFNNMLSVIIGFTEMALAKITPQDPLHEGLTEVLDAAQKSAGITRQLLAFARQQVVAPKVLDLNQGVEGSLKMLRRLIGEDIELTWQPGNNLGMIKIDPSQIDQLLANLCINARDAIDGTGEVIIETGTVQLDEKYCADHEGFVPGEYVTLTVGDSGSGMDQETMGHLFEPFFTTKTEGKGTGLGLATVFGIVKQNHGFVNVYSEPRQGSTFRIYLPKHQNTEEQETTGQVSAADTRGTETILVVDDNEALLKITARMLEQLGYAVLTATAPVMALDLAGKHDGKIHLLMTDVVMPDMGDRELGELLQKQNPELEILFMSGYSASTIAHRGVLNEGVNFIAKPFTMQELASKIREALAS